LVYLIIDIVDIPDKLYNPEGLCGIFEYGLNLVRLSIIIYCAYYYGDSWDEFKYILLFTHVTCYPDTPVIYSRYLLHRYSRYLFWL